MTKTDYPMVASEEETFLLLHLMTETDPVSRMLSLEGLKTMDKSKIIVIFIVKHNHKEHLDIMRS